MYVELRLLVLSLTPATCKRLAEKNEKDILSTRGYTVLHAEHQRIALRTRHALQALDTPYTHSRRAYMYATRAIHGVTRLTRTYARFYPLAAMNGDNEARCGSAYDVTFTAHELFGHFLGPYRYRQKSDAPRP